ncbi:MAG TPA: GNAT family N-acetyltransferase [bacterium]|nr:GNAT family N-acetyltransferase [bacterium]HPM47261.1 GNAT family N-acetyltransferase [bacterium]HPV20220.1 GNAT family N-acetyltransferase [bacterium]HQB08230.1 GNAT family N-acetyltransferase [bacterium]HQI03630.1 GNAT family N-acetyltransferase [bacterium]
MKLRDKIVQTDLEFIREILVSTGFFYDFEVATAVEIGEEVLAKGDAAGYHFLFVEDEDFKPYGFTSFGDIPCTKNRFDLYWIGVHEKMRGKGIGSVLLKESEKAVKSLDGKILYIETSARELYNPTRGFYLKNGYKIETILEDFYDDGDGKVIYSKRLN